MPIRWAALLFSIGLLLVLTIGFARRDAPAELYAAEVVNPPAQIVEGPRPPWPFTAPRLRPSSITALAQAVPSSAITETIPESDAESISQATAGDSTAVDNATVGDVTVDSVTTDSAMVDSTDAAASIPVTEPTPIPLPTATPAPAIPTSAAPAVAVQSPPAYVALSGMRHYWQTWNNCGPATLAMNLSYYGSPLDQGVIGSALRPSPDDKNVSPEELARYAREQGYMAQVRVNGSADLARTFLSNGIPLLLHTWLEEEPDDGMGHYRLLAGYDDAQASWIVYDSYVSTNLITSAGSDYAGIYWSYDLAEARWQVFNYSYVLIYPPEQEPLVQAILGDAYDLEVMWQQSLARAQAAAAADPNNPFTHFNVGTNLLHQQDYAGAAAAYDQARAIGLPWRMLWYQFGPFEAYTQMGRYQEVIDLAQATLNSAGGAIEELHYWQGHALAALGNPDAARAQWQTTLALNPDFTKAQEALQGLNVN